MNLQRDNMQRQTIYCSGVSKSSAGDGTKENPYSTLAKALGVDINGWVTANNVDILLERGYVYDFFYEVNLKSIGFGAYGYGNAPVVSRFAKVRNDGSNLFVKDAEADSIWTEGVAERGFVGCRLQSIKNIELYLKAHDNHAMFVGLVEPVSNPN